MERQSKAVLVSFISVELVFTFGKKREFKAPLLYFMLVVKGIAPHSTCSCAAPAAECHLFFSLGHAYGSQ